MKTLLVGACVSLGLLTVTPAHSENVNLGIIVQSNDNGALASIAMPNFDREADADRLLLNEFGYLTNKALSFKGKEIPKEFQAILPESFNPKKDKVLTSIWLKNFTFNPNLPRNQKITLYCTYADLNNFLQAADPLSQAFHDILCSNTEQRARDLSRHNLLLESSYLNWSTIEPVPQITAPLPKREEEEDR